MAKSNADKAREAKEKKDKADLDSFKAYMSGVTAISELSNTANNDFRTKERDGARSSLVKIASDYALSAKEIDAPLNPSDSNSYGIAKNYAGAIQQRNLNLASNVFSSNLEGIVVAAGKGIEGLVDSEDIANAAGSKYAPFVAAYQNLLETKRLAAKVKAGDRDNPLAKNAISIAAKSAGDTARARTKKEGLAMDLQDTAAELASYAVQTGFRKVDYNAVADQVVADAEKALKEYETKSGQSLRGYITAGLTGLAKNGTEGFNQARDLLYSVISKK